MDSFYDPSVSLLTGFDCIKWLKSGFGILDIPSFIKM